MANILQWLISAAARSSKSKTPGRLSQGDLLKLFYHGDREAEDVISLVYSNNNRGIIFTPKDETSYWHKFTLQAAKKIDADPDAAAEYLMDELAAPFYDDLRPKLRSSLFEDQKRDEYLREDFRKSRFESLLDAFSSDVRLSDKTCARLMVMMFAELVFFLEEKRFRPDDGAMLARLMDSKGSSAGTEVAAAKNNVYMKDRRSLEKEYLIGDLMEGASDVWMYNMTITGLVWGREKKGVIDHKRGIFERCLDGGTTFTVIIPMPGSVGEKDSARSKLCQTYPGNLSSLEVMKKTRDQLINDIEERSSGGEGSPISLYFTPYAVPYSMMLVRFNEHPERDHVKIDLHTPYLPQDMDRRSFYIFRKDDPVNFKFFEDSYAVIRSRSVSYEEWKEDNRK